MQKKIPVVCLCNDEPLSAAIREKALETFVWSANAASYNLNPKEGPPGEELPADMKKLANTPLIDGADAPVMTFSGFVGDWEYEVKDFKMPWHYNTEEICLTCRARKHGVAFNYADASASADWNRSENRRTLKEYVDHVVSSGLDFNPLCGLRGFHTHNFFEDQLHCDLLGGRQRMNGSILRDFVQAGEFGSVAPTRI